MNCVLKSRNLTPMWAVSLLLIVPVLAWGQHKPSGGGGGAPKAPASHTSTQHTSAPSHSTASHATTPSRSTSTTHSTTGTRSNTTAAHTTATGRTNASTGRTNTSTGRTNTTTGRTSATGRTNTNTGRTNTNTGRTNTNAGRTNTGTGARGNAGAGAHVSNASRSTPAGRSVSLKGGGTANVRPNGSVRSIDRNGMHIENGVHGGRTVVTTHNGATIVSHGHSGYVQRAYVTRGGHSYVSRTYVYHGVVHVGVYRSYYWGGHAYYGWHAGFYWHPGFYGWGLAPWGAPLYWGVGLWGWGGSPWWGFYGGWWNPYPYYAAPAFWLTDYLIASQLQAAYAARQEDAAADAAAASGGDGGGGDAQPAPASTQVTLTPEVKEAIAEEVKAQIAAQQAQAQQSGGASAPAPAPSSAPAAAAASNDQVPPALDPAHRTFVVDTGVTAVNNGQECGLSSGDVITRLTDTPDANNTVNVSVAAGQKNDCGTGQTVAVKVDDLQEMYNHFQDQLQNGMSEMAKKQGTNGMPKSPDTGTTASDVPPPQADPNAAKTLQDQQAQADQTESQVKQETAQAGGQ
jgi:hypothetical protein